MNIKISLSQNGISQLQKQLKDYAKKTLPQKSKLFVEKLAEHGINVANNNTVTTAVYFYKQIEEIESGCKALMIGADKFKILSEWLAWGEYKTAEVSPLLMAEFGSGYMAENPMNVEGYGQGTFPEQTHAFDVGGWKWMDLDGNWHHSEGVAPTMPMYSAWLGMYSEIEKIAKEVFGNG